MRYIYFVVTIPIIILGYICLTFNIFQIKYKLNECMNLTDKKCVEIPDFYISYIAAEDHRSDFHYGVDQIGMLRAICKVFFNHRIQGASTIEQQFVRVVTGDYSYSLKRKLKEQILAVILVRKRKKIDIARAYLAIAYYGHDCKGTEGISNLAGYNLRLVSETQIISIMARLKYPQPSVNIDKWETKFNHRVSYIRKRHQRLAKKLEQQEMNAAA
ncbi:transglycosylase domain-containing protein [Psychrobacter sp. NPDC064578]|uniref:transglycosylase domain-containing protein n=1 Tax=Psychrobacter sp. NPDC064578 TaxID=3364493 RepID=UPI00384CC7BB